MMLLESHDPGAIRFVHDQAGLDDVPPFSHPEQTFTELHQLQMGSHPPLILIVDDDRYIGDLMKVLLEDAGFAVIVALDAEMAFRAAQRSDPDLILSDYMMPLTDGVAFRQRVKADPQLKATPFAMMSSRRARLPDMEGVPFLAKPFDIDDVINFINRHIRRTQLRGEG